MDNKENTTEEIVYKPQDHPWIEMPEDDLVDEAIRYSLDEIRLR